MEEDTFEVKGGFLVRVVTDAHITNIGGLVRATRKFMDAHNLIPPSSVSIACCIEGQVSPTRSRLTQSSSSGKLIQMFKMQTNREHMEMDMEVRMEDS